MLPPVKHKKGYHAAYCQKEFQNFVGIICNVLMSEEEKAGAKNKQLQGATVLLMMDGARTPARPKRALASARR